MRSCINGATTMPYSLEEDIISAGQAGFEAVEIWGTKLEKYLEGHSVADLRGLLKENGLAVAAICPINYGLSFFSNVEQNMQGIERFAGYASQIGCPVLLVCPDVPPAGVVKDEAIKQAGEVGAKYAELTKPYGVKLALEPLGMHPFVPGPKEALEILRVAGHEYLGMMMDLFHYYKSGVPFEDIERIPIEKLLIIHVDDCEDLPREELMDGHRVYPGLGVMPVVEMLRIVRDKGYDKFLSVEIFREEYWRESPAEISKAAKRHLDEVLSKL